VMDVTLIPCACLQTRYPNLARLTALIKNNLEEKSYPLTFIH
jgi:hypothetical protein